MKFQDNFAVICRRRGGVCLALLACCLLAACFGRSAGAPAAVFDFGAPPSAAAPAALPLRGIDVTAPSWLDTPALQYRLAHVEAARRHAYAESRWAAAPAELLERALRRALLGGTEAAAGCRLRVELDEFIQVFDAASASHGELALRATLTSTQAERVLARKSFSFSEPAARADASGAADALARAGMAAAAALRDWVAALPAEIGKTCRNV
ncbi:MAG: membrane integrity-associated transporter subunit PqiC [Rhodocyclaceae bacterium]|nr:membrane integrity-associated transporter subunit PqiC [Rhodocyclaceae bacterium]